MAFIVSLLSQYHFLFHHLPSPFFPQGLFLLFEYFRLTLWLPFRLSVTGSYIHLDSHRIMTDFYLRYLTTNHQLIIFLIKFIFN